MKKSLLLTFLAVFLLSACGTIQKSDVSPSQNYRLKGESKTIRISGNIHSVFSEYDGRALSRTLTVYIDGQPVLTGGLTYMFSGEGNGKWKDKEVQSVCAGEQKTPRWVDVRCTILIDNEKTVVLTF